MQTAGGKSSFVAPNGLTAEEIRAHTDRILASPAFRSSKRCHRFLGFIVSQVLEGKASTIKERTLATEVFDRSASWDSAGEDTIVRVGAREVRKRLAQFYSSPEGAREKLRVELPLGSYVPEFVKPEAPVQVAIAPVVSIESKPIEPRKRSRWWLAAAVALIVLAAVAIRMMSSPGERDGFDTFWAPFFHSSEPILIAIASPVVYTPTSKAWATNDSRMGPGIHVTQPLRMPLSQLSGSDFVSVQYQFLAYGDAVAAADVQSVLAVHNKEARLRFASKLEFADFRDAPAVLLGAFTNTWTLEMTQHLRYHFGYDPKWIPAVLDSANPNRSWNIPQKKDDGSSPEDYLVIARLKTSAAGTPILIGAGLAQFGTEAAGRFLDNPRVMDDILHKVSGDWANRNVELVLHARVIENSPATPELIASYVW